MVNTAAAAHSANTYPQATVLYAPDGTALRADTYKSVAATASGNTTVWTPAAGKKFRLLGYRISITNNANVAAGAVVTVLLTDGAGGATIGAESVFVPTTAVVTNVGCQEVGWGLYMTTGFLSAAANNLLVVNLSAAITTGNLRVNCWGCEE